MPRMPSKTFEPGRDGEPIPWQPCCGSNMYFIYPAARLVIWWKRRRHV